MEIYTVLLRGINVSGKKSIKMVDLRSSLEKKGFDAVQTYIQSGNIVFKTDNKKIAELEEGIKKLIFEDFGFDVPVLVKTAKDLKSILRHNPFSKEENTKQLFFVLLRQPPSKLLVDEFNELKFEGEDFHITDACVYLNCKIGYGKAKLNNNLIEKKLKVEATARNLRTMQKLIEMAS
ncbi:DUF1697 domain-containing protein [Allomuricauda sp. SCSIO 65647]|uniref:DUF1697 domain-containing protein n=1 Tax=Allomuricauda sp. SCSIO 65647 TaxID=2908843 RepID=UPI001F26BFF1|nr:DUF1697 domain-containing protein [Muricauda sp. SCSIO 65647]UJH66255.1 DUF1697 domain-containing protein [Muricauda sp. SCSIO 65647]